MSLIIEDKNTLNVLANTIIGANKSITDSSATKSELIEMINNIIPEKSKFSSGIVIPATEITTDNMPEIPFNLGIDDNGNVIVPDMIVIYQPKTAIEETGSKQANVICLMFPKLKRLSSQPSSFFCLYTKVGDGTLVGGVTGGCNYNVTQLKDTSFFLYSPSSYPWQAAKPIVWLQIKF